MNKNKKEIKNKKGSINLYRPFLYFLVVFASLSVMYLLQDFLIEIIIAAMFATFTYPLYQRFSAILSDKSRLAALIMTFILLIIIVAPLTQLVIYGANEAPNLLKIGQSLLDNINDIEDHIFSFIDISPESQANVRAGVLTIVEDSSDTLMNYANSFLKNLSSFFLAIFIFLFSYFYFLVHGQKVGKKFLRFSPLEHKYNLELIDSFKSISRSSFWSIGVSAVIQGILSALSLMLIGWPFLIAFAISFILALVPYFLAILYIPIAIYLVSLGMIWPAILILAWNLLIVVNIDKLIRAYVAKGDTKVNMIFMLFAILGGISLFGIAGVFIGPLVAVLALKIIDIYGQVFSHKLDE